MSYSPWQLGALPPAGYLCKKHGLDPCPVCDGCEIEGHRPGTLTCIDCGSVHHE